MKRWQYLIVLCLSVFFLFDVKPKLADAEETATEYGYCMGEDLVLRDIPVADFSSFAYPLRKMVCPKDKKNCSEHEKISVENFRITQKYMTPQKDALCDEKQCLWGHDGIDITERSVAEGVYDVIAIQPGKVLVKMVGDQDFGWGHRMVLATRVSAYSEQILTFHYAHLFNGSLLHQPCGNVLQGRPIAKEGDSGWSTGTHLHLTVRLWDNLKQLQLALEKQKKNDELEAKNPLAKPDRSEALFQKGYVNNNVQFLADKKYLDPYFLFTGKFQDFECQGDACPTWAKASALAGRRAGIDMGRYDRYFAVNPQSDTESIDILKKGESARWLKVAREFENVGKQTATFTDVPKTSDFFPYVETLVHHGILSATNDCDPGQAGQQFCPDQIRTRAEILKMVIDSFMKEPFQEWLEKKNDWWPLGENAEIREYYNQVQSDYYFLDMHENDGGWHWSADYVLFAAFNKHKKLINVWSFFRPEDPIDKLEAIKLVLTAKEHWMKKSPYVPCDTHYCGTEQMCTGSPDPVCITFPGCDNSNPNMQCKEYGGGINEPACPDFVCNPGEEKQQPCGMAGTQTQTCNSDCQWDPWGSCEDQGTCSPGESAMCGNCGTMTCGPDGLWGACLNEGTCTPDESQTRACGTNGTQTTTCNASCEWEPWSTCQEACVCTSGQCCDGCNFLPPTQLCNNGYQYRCEGTARGQDAQQRYLATYCSGTDAGCNGETVPSSWEIYEDCSSNEVCQMSGDRAACVTACTDTYVASPLEACYTNTTMPGSPVLCLRVEQISGASWRYQLCKQGGVFTFAFDYTLEDDASGRLWPMLTGAAGSSCSDWQTIDMSYIAGYGSGNGAGLMVNVRSPAGCTGVNCEGNTDYVTLYKECR